MGLVQTKVEGAHPIPDDVMPKSEWGPAFDRDAGFAVQALGKYWMSIFVHRHLASPFHKSRSEALQRSEEVIARCISCVDEEWEIRSEPIGGNEFGLVAYTEKGKAI